MVKPVNKTLQIAAMSGGVELGHVSGPIASFRSNGDPLRSLLVNIDPVQEGSGDPSPDNVRPISGWDGMTMYHSGADTSDPTTYPITWQSAGTVYGGTYDPLTGKLRVTHQQIIAGDYTWNKSGSVYYYHPYNLYTEVIPETPTGRKPIVCSHLGYNDSSAATPATIGYGGINNNGNLTILESTYLELDLSEVQIVYPLATPIEYTLTPQQISSLVGENNVWADTGDVDVTYVAVGGEGGKLALLLRKRKELLIALRKGLTPADAGLLSSTLSTPSSLGNVLSPGVFKPGLTPDIDKEEDDLW